MPFCVDKIKGSLAEMETGFRLLADFSNMESMAMTCGVYIREIMGLCNAKGVSAVTRVLPDPRKDIGLFIMSCFHYGPNVRIITCESMAEAMRSLDD